MPSLNCRHDFQATVDLLFLPLIAEGWSAALAGSPIGYGFDRFRKATRSGPGSAGKNQKPGAR